MRQQQVVNHALAFWNNAVRIQTGVRTEVVILDVAHINHTLDDGVLVQLPHIVVNVRIRRNKPSVGFEVHYVYLIEANQRHKQTDVKRMQAIIAENVSLRR